MDATATIWERTVDEIGRRGWDAVVASTPANVAYIIGITIPSQRSMYTRPAAAVVTKTGRVGLVVVDMEKSYVESVSPVKDIISYNEFTDQPIDVLSQLLTDFGVTRGKIGFENWYVPWSQSERLFSSLSETRFEEINDFFIKLRAIKTPDELDILRDVGRLTIQAHYDVLSGSSFTGRTECSVAANLLHWLMERGAEEVEFMIVGSGDRSIHANPVPTMKLIEAGEILRTDIGVKKSGYCSDVARTSVLGNPTDEQKRVWEILVNTQQLVLQQIRAGVSTRTIYRQFCREFESSGLKPIDFVGHGLGLEVHEGPYIDRFTNSRLECGNVLCIEPYYMDDRGMGFQLEDEIIVTEDGYELITEYGDRDKLIVLH